MDWLNAVAIAIGAVLAVAYGIRAAVIWRAGNPAWRRWGLVSALFVLGVALVIAASLVNR